MKEKNQENLTEMQDVSFQILSRYSINTFNLIDYIRYM